MSLASNNPAFMRAAVVTTAGPADSFLVTEIPVPTISDGDVLIRQAFAAVNHGDIVRRKRGMFAAAATPPYVLGFEGAGVVVGVGRGVADFEVGDRVAYLLESGGYAEYVAAPAAKVWRLSDNVSDEQAASATCVGLTAWGLLIESAPGDDDHVIVHGAAGGVGSVLVQLLEATQARVTCIVSGAGKVEYMHELTSANIVDLAVRSSLEELRGRADSFQIIYDCVGTDVVELNSALIASGGKWMYYGSTSGHAAFSGITVLMKHICVQGFVVFDYFTDAQRWRAGTNALGQMLGAGTLKVPVAQVLPLADVGKAHQALEQRQVRGKVLLSF